MDVLILLKIKNKKMRAYMFASNDCFMRMNDLFRLRNEGFFTPKEFKRDSK